MLGMHTEIAREQTALDALFEPLNRAKAGTEEWQKAKDAIVAKYGGYLEKVGCGNKQRRHRLHCL